ncbi:MAG: hypothetical protein IJV88_04560 [Ruminococcus sp.]|nr:hypothetical protein [Ruminococcus sp.]
MKKCNYCAKEIGYNDMYCCEECEIKNNEYYNTRVKYQKLLSAMNIIGTCSIAIGIFLYALHNAVGAGLCTLGGFCVGLITLLLPTPTDNMISGMKLKKAVFIVRIVGVILLLFGAGALWLLITKI